MNSYRKKVGVCAAPLIICLENLPPATKKLPDRICFDNMFTSFSLLKRLKTLGYGGTDTVIENRMGRSFPIPNSKSCKKKSRGYIAWSKIFDDDSISVRWKESNAVSIASNVHGIPGFCIVVSIRTYLCWPLGEALCSVI